LPWLETNYTLVKILPQGEAETFDVWVAKKRVDVGMK